MKRDLKENNNKLHDYLKHASYWIRGNIWFCDNI